MYACVFTCLLIVNNRLSFVLLYFDRFIYAYNIWRQIGTKPKFLYLVIVVFVQLYIHVDYRSGGKPPVSLRKEQMGINIHYRLILI